ncbi:cysteine desulfurase family protein [Oricola sp.]|uniref:cysteine desulfurase family protein n=1 Tax=Oricola sp. TaxID=1979950 RepID=UPI003BABAE0E
MANAGIRHYLDFNASAPLLPEARAAIVEALDVWGNPSSVHADGRKAKAIVQNARRALAALVNTKQEHVVFTSSATEAASTLLSPAYSFGRSPLRVSKLYRCGAEHPCILNGGRFDTGDTVTLPIHDNGLLDLDSLGEALSRHVRLAGTPLVAVHWANNETGVIQPVAEIARIVKQYGGILVVDAVQALGRVDIDLSQDVGDFVILSSHKIGGPKGAGAIVAASDMVMPMPLIAGGGQERGHRGGTEAVQAIAGFGAAAEVAARSKARVAELSVKRDRLEAAILELAPDAVIHGRTAPRLANTTFFSIPGIKAETAQIAFDLAGIAVSAGSACSSGKVGPSHVLKAMGTESEDGAIRVSFGLSTPESAYSEFEAASSKIVARSRGEKRLKRA